MYDSKTRYLCQWQVASGNQKPAEAGIGEPYLAEGSSSSTVIKYSRLWLQVNRQAVYIFLVRGGGGIRTPKILVDELGLLPSTPTAELS